MKRLKPKRIVEIGVGGGSSSWTMLRACPDATVYGIDSGLQFPGFVEHARKILPQDRFELHIVDSHSLDKIPPCDLCHVDGDHSRDGAIMDMDLAYRSGAPVILVDDYTMSNDVRLAVHDFMSLHPELSGQRIDSPHGWYLIERR